MKHLIVNSTPNFTGNAIPVVSGGFGQDKQCISDNTVAEIYGVTTRDIRKAIGRNANRFKGLVDFIDLKSSSCGDDLCEQLGYSKQQITQAEHDYILSQRGYSKLEEEQGIDVTEVNTEEASKRLSGMFLSNVHTLCNPDTVIGRACAFRSTQKEERWKFRIFLIQFDGRILVSDEY